VYAGQCQTSETSPAQRASYLEAAAELLAEREEASLAEQLIADACTREGIEPQQLIVHADRGAPMTSKLVAELMLDLGVTRSHSRPSVSNDHPYSEAQCAPRHAAVDRSRRELEREGGFQGHPPQAEPKGRADRSMVGTRHRLRSVASWGAARPASYGKGWIASTLVPTRRNPLPLETRLHTSVISYRARNCGAWYPSAGEGAPNGGE